MGIRMGSIIWKRKCRAKRAWMDHTDSIRKVTFERIVKWLTPCVFEGQWGLDPKGTVGGE